LADPGAAYRWSMRTVLLIWVLLYTTVLFAGAAAPDGSGWPGSAAVPSLAGSALP